MPASTALRGYLFDRDHLLSDRVGSIFQLRREAIARSAFFNNWLSGLHSGVITDEYRLDLVEACNVPTQLVGTAASKSWSGSSLMVEVEEHIIRELVALVLTLDPVIEFAADRIDATVNTCARSRPDQR
jgi:hypothetical protein